MYFHILWIKEKEWNQNELDILIQWWDESFIRKFLENRWVVTVSIRPYKDDVKTFWNISVLVSFENVEIEILTTGENLDEKTYFFLHLWLSLHSINFVDNPIPDWEMQEMIKSNIAKIQSEEESIKKEKEERQLAEQKKYSESAIDDSLKIINYEISHIEQVMKAGEAIVSPMEAKKLEDLANEMKKIRLWTNFNKMVSLVMYAQDLTKKLENEILEKYDSQKFLIDKNSIITNIDFISELSNANRIWEKATLKPNALTTHESFYNMIWVNNAALISLFIKDLSYTFSQRSFDVYFYTIINFIEYATLISIIVVSLLWLIWPFLWTDKFSLYLLPILGWIGLLIYLLNNLKIKWIISKFVGLVVFGIIYRVWLVLLHGTFSI